MQLLLNIRGAVSNDILDERTAAVELCQLFEQRMSNSAAREKCFVFLNFLAFSQAQIQICAEKRRFTVSLFTYNLDHIISYNLYDI